MRNEVWHHHHHRQTGTVVFHWHTCDHMQFLCEAEPGLCRFRLMDTFVPEPERIQDEQLPLNGL